MRRLIALLLLLAATTAAPATEVFATMDMQNGSRLFLSTAHGDCGRGYSGVLAGATHRAMGLCWGYDDGRIYVWYGDGDLRIYPVNSFKLRKQQPGRVQL